MDELMQALDVRDLEIERRLDLFAGARLSPDPAGAARTRARIMREARLAFEAARIAAHVAPIVAPRRSLLSRIAMPLLAASVWVVIAIGSVAAAQPGGPLYPTRLWIEAATLPSGPAARTQAELSHLDERLAEALAAASRGDRNAVAAALAAYQSIADAALADSAGSNELEQLVESALDKHVAVLEAVAASLNAKGNATAADSVERNIQRTIERNQETVSRIGSGGGGGAGNGATGGSGTGGSGSAGGGGGNGGSTGGAGPTADPGAPTPTNGNGKPDRTPRPTPSATASHGPGDGDQDD
jgi:uncharacterized membrane protein YgcG